MNISEEEYAELLRRRAPTANPVRRKVPLESEIERDCTQVLIHDGWRPLKTDPVSDRRRGKGFGELGMADYLYIRYQDAVAGITSGRTWTTVECRANSQVLWIEWKRETGEAAPHQLKWHERERANGALTLIAGIDFPATVEGFMEFYAKSGLKR